MTTDETHEAGRRHKWGGHVKLPETGHIWRPCMRCGVWSYVRPGKHAQADVGEPPVPGMTMTVENWRPCNG